ncbi:hypothetical protein [Alloactinosynnema sp. L-07]|nr:hypothetical protein [Alloactinosynnema sp. L-07]
MVGASRVAEDWATAIFDGIESSTACRRLSGVRVQGSLKCGTGDRWLSQCEQSGWIRECG